MSYSKDDKRYELDGAIHAKIMTRTESEAEHTLSVHSLKNKKETITDSLSHVRDKLAANKPE